MNCCYCHCGYWHMRERVRKTKRRSKMRIDKFTCTHQSVCWSSMTSRVLHLSLLYCCLWFPVAEENRERMLGTPLLLGLDGALGEGPFFGKLKPKEVGCSCVPGGALSSSPVKSLELKRRRRKFIPGEKWKEEVRRKFMTKGKRRR